VLYALKCLNWWLEKIKRLDDFHDPYERGEYILSEWKPYYDFLERIGKTEASGREARVLNSEDSCQYAVKRFVYSLALDFFLAVIGENNQQDPALLLQAGRCCKGAGNWEEALKYLELASRYKREDSAILSELADVNALLGDARAAKVLFREAFFLDPQGIDLKAMESEMILALRDKVISLGQTGPELAEWIPVWGCIWGIFSIKRELKPVELGRLKQSILSLESEFRSKSGGSPHIKPRLLNRYFWLIDHCEHSRDTLGLMDETMLKIKVIDPVVYEQYRT
jgi:tetratricopeptide (TPR) repeat protein